jgi:hypothetical protein
MSLLQIIVGVAWLIWLGSGTAGLQNGLTVGAFLAIGLGVLRFLDTFSNGKGGNKEIERRPAYEVETPSRFAPRNRGALPSANWNLSRFSDPVDSDPLPRFDRR